MGVVLFEKARLLNIIHRRLLLHELQSTQFVSMIPLAEQLVAWLATSLLACAASTRVDAAVDRCCTYSTALPSSLSATGTKRSLAGATDGSISTASDCSIAIVQQAHIWCSSAATVQLHCHSVSSLICVHQLSNTYNCAP
jgi:hypothetical protein